MHEADGILNCGDLVKVLSRVAEDIHVCPLSCSLTRECSLFYMESLPPAVTDSNFSSAHEVPGQVRGQLGVILKTSREQALEQLPHGSLTCPRTPLGAANFLRVFESPCPIFFGSLIGRIGISSGFHGCWPPFSSGFWPFFGLPRAPRSGCTSLDGTLD